MFNSITVGVHYLKYCHKIQKAEVRVHSLNILNTHIMSTRHKTGATEFHLHLKIIPLPKHHKELTIQSSCIRINFKWYLNYTSSNLLVQSLISTKTKRTCNIYSQAQHLNYPQHKLSLSKIRLQAAETLSCKCSNIDESYSINNNYLITTGITKLYLPHHSCCQPQPLNVEFSSFLQVSCC